MVAMEKKSVERPIIKLNHAILYSIVECSMYICLAVSLIIQS
jgi:hypothetical protein